MNMQQDGGGNWDLQDANLVGNVQDNVTAKASGTQSTAVQITKNQCVVTTVATIGDAVKLPPGRPNLDILVVNAAANAMTVFGFQTADTINGVAAATGVSQMGGSYAVYSYSTSQGWSVDLGVGFSGQYPTFSYQAAVTAHSGGGQTNATAITATTANVTTVAAQSDSVKLPVSKAGMAITLINNGAHAMQVFGTGSDTINSVTATTGVSHGINQVTVYECVVTGNWLVQFAAQSQVGLEILSGSGDAINPHVPHTYLVNTAGVDAMTLAAPTATTDDGVEITVTSNTANAHTLTATGILQTGGTATSVLTFASHAGASVTLMAYQGKWNVLCLNNVALTS